MNILITMYQFSTNDSNLTLTMDQLSVCTAPRSAWILAEGVFFAPREFRYEHAQWI